MDQVSVSREVAAPADVVWRLVSDVTRMGEWSPETTAGVWIGGAAGPEVGARFRGRNRNGVHRWSTTCTVSRADPGEAFEFHVTFWPVKVATWGYEIVATEGGCRVTESWTDDRGGLATLLGRPISGVSDRAAHNRASMEETLLRLAAVAESGSAP